METDCLHNWKRNCDGSQTMNTWWIRLLFNILNALQDRIPSAADGIGAGNLGSIMPPPHPTQSVSAEETATTNRSIVCQWCLSSSPENERAWLQDPAGYASKGLVRQGHSSECSAALLK
jgi:hypothetical protein